VTNLSLFRLVQVVRDNHQVVRLLQAVCDKLWVVLHWLILVMSDKPQTERWFVTGLRWYTDHTTQPERDV
jgi:hypothetical protein